MARTDEELILLGKRYIAENTYESIYCWECGNVGDNPICRICPNKEDKKTKREVELRLNWVYELSDEEVEKLYKEIEEYENN